MGLMVAKVKGWESVVGRFLVRDVGGVGGADGRSREGQERREGEEQEGEGQKMRIGGW